MSLGSNLYQARKGGGMTQEEVADIMEVARQTVSKWERDEALPNIYQLQELASFYHKELSELVERDDVMKEIKAVLDKTTEKNVDKVDWTKVWSKKYPVLDTYPEEIDVSFYATQLQVLLQSLEGNYQYSKLDAMLVLKDILAKEWKKNNKD